MEHIINAVLGIGTGMIVIVMFGLMCADIIREWKKGR